MEERELQEVETALRAFAEGHGLAWVLQQVDGDIAAGVTESKQLRKSTRNNAISYTEVDGRTGGRQRYEDFLTQRPMTAEERTILLLSAIERAVVGTRSIAVVTVAEMRDREGLPPVSGITFEPDMEFGESADVRVDVIELSRNDTAGEIATVLQSLRDLIES